MIRGIGIGLINAPLVSTSFNAIRQEQTSMASGLYNVIHQLGGAFGIAMLGTILQRREFFHYAHYVQQIRDVFSPSTSRALLTMQELLLRYGLEPTEVAAKGKGLLAQWVHGLAKVAAFQDAFVAAGLFVAVGIVPSLLIRTAQLIQPARRGEITLKLLSHFLLPELAQAFGSEEGKFVAPGLRSALRRKGQALDLSLKEVRR